MLAGHELGEVVRVQERGGGGGPQLNRSSLLRPLYLSLLEMAGSHLLSARPAEEQPLPEYIQQRHELHAALVDAIADGDVKALDLIAEHNTRRT